MNQSTYFLTTTRRELGLPERAIQNWEQLQSGGFRNKFKEKGGKNRKKREKEIKKEEKKDGRKRWQIKRSVSEKEERRLGWPMPMEFIHTWLIEDEIQKYKKKIMMIIIIIIKYFFYRGRFNMCVGDNY